LSAVLGLLIYQVIVTQTQSWLAGLAGVVVFASSTLVFAWFTVVKTHCLAGLLLFAAYAVLGGKTEVSRWRVALCGLLLALSAETRSFLLLVTPLFLWWIYRHVHAEGRLKSALWFAAGFVVGSLPSLYLFLSAPDVFLFDNLRYHGLRSTSGLIGWWQQKLVVFVRLFLGSREGNGLQWSILFLTSFGLVLAAPARAVRARFTFQIAVLLTIIGLLPTPTYAQYFCLCVPSLVVAAVCGVADVFAHLESRRDRLPAAAACVCVFALYLGVSVGDMRKYLVTGDGVPGVQTALDRSDWRLSRVLEASDAVNRLARPGEIVPSFWPGDIFQTDAAPFPGFENPFALPIADKLTAEQRARYHILSPEEIEANFDAQQPRVVVLRNQILSALTPQELERMERLRQIFVVSLETHGYTIAQSVGGISIYIRSSNPRPSEVSVSPEN
jgi:hypothetical protein